MLDILANHPATARFIATKLARRFVSDNPPQPLVDRATNTFRETHGDLRAVMATILTSPEFLSPDAYRAKVKSPLRIRGQRGPRDRRRCERCAAARPRDAAARHASVSVPAANRYKDTADAWVNAGALVNRMNDALALASGRMPGVIFQTRRRRNRCWPATCRTRHGRRSRRQPPPSSSLSRSARRSFNDDDLEVRLADIGV